VLHYPQTLLCKCNVLNWLVLWSGEAITKLHYCFSGGWISDCLKNSCLHTWASTVRLCYCLLKQLLACVHEHTHSMLALCCLLNSCLRSRAHTHTYIITHKQCALKLPLKTQLLAYVSVQSVHSPRLGSARLLSLCLKAAQSVCIWFDWERAHHLFTKEKAWLWKKSSKFSQRGSTEPEKGVFLKCELSMVSTAGSLQAQYLVIALAPSCCVHLSLKTASRGDHA